MRDRVRGRIEGRRVVCEVDATYAERSGTLHDCDKVLCLERVLLAESHDAAKTTGVFEHRLVRLCQFGTFHVTGGLRVPHAFLHMREYTEIWDDHAGRPAKSGNW